MNDLTHLDEIILTDYLDDALAPEVRLTVEHHLAACADCAAQVAEFRSLFVALAELPPLTLERNLAPAVLAAIQPAPMPTPSVRGLRWLVAAQLMLAVLLLATLWQLALPSLAGIEVAAQSWWSSVNFTPLLIQAQGMWDAIVTPFQQLTFPTFSDLTGISALSWNTAAVILLVAVVGWFAGNRWLLMPQRVGATPPS